MKKPSNRLAFVRAFIKPLRGHSYQSVVRRGTAWSIRHRAFVMLGVLASLVFSGYVYSTKLPKEFLGESEKDEFIIFVELPSGSNPTGHVRLDRQLVAALVATGLQDGATGTGSHSGAKAVGFGPLALVRLIGTLHKHPLLKLFRCASRYPRGVAGTLLRTILSVGTYSLSGGYEMGVW